MENRVNIALRNAQLPAECYNDVQPDTIHNGVADISLFWSNNNKKTTALDCTSYGVLRVPLCDEAQSTQGLQIRISLRIDSNGFIAVKVRVVLFIWYAHGHMSRCAWRNRTTCNDHMCPCMLYWSLHALLSLRCFSDQEHVCRRASFADAVVRTCHY